MIGDLHRHGDLIVDEVDLADDPSGFEPMWSVQGLTTTEVVASIIDSTATFGTPEVIYRRKPGESIPDAADRLRAEVMQTASDVMRVLGIED